MLIIGCGNRQRGDDAAGIMVAERLRTLGIEAEMCAGESSQLMDAWSGAADVIVIDSVVSGAPAGTLHVWNGQHPLTLGKSASSTHSLGLGEAIELARALGCLPARLCIYGIEGKTFEIGGVPSEEVQLAVEEVSVRIAQELKGNNR